MVKTAMLSVRDKRGIVSFASQLVEFGWSILASEGTAKALSDAGIQIRDVSELVGGSPILDHRVVTLSRELHAALLARDTPEDQAELDQLGIPRIDLVCVGLYPLADEIARDGSTQESITEITDIGGPTLLRSAAKGGRIVVCDSADYQRVIDWLNGGQPEKDEFIRALAAEAEGMVADYCLASARSLSNGGVDGFVGTELESLRYGENPQQGPAALYTLGTGDPLALDRFRLVAGTDPSFVNVTDIDRMLQTIIHIAAAWDVNYGSVPMIAVAVKHGNSCGVAIGRDSIKVLQKMIAGDTRAIFGGLVMTNFALGKAEAEVIRNFKVEEGPRRILDAIIAPEFSGEAIDLLKRKQGKCRFLVNPALASLNAESLDQSWLFRPVRGGFMRQPNYDFVLRLDDLRIEKTSQATAEQEEDILLAWAIGATSNSNTVTLVADGHLIGNGVGQKDRVGACDLSIRGARGAGHEITGAVAYSDSFFPFDDGPELLANAGVSVIFATSGSIHDSEIAAFCEGRGVTLYRIPNALARGFYGH